MDRQILVYVDLDSMPHLVGRLWLHVRNRVESATFRYDERWLRSPVRFALEPALQMDPGPPQAHKIVRKAAHAVSRWRQEAAALRIPAAEIETVASAFEHDDLRRNRTGKIFPKR